MPTEIVVGPDEYRLAEGGDVLLARQLGADWAVAIHHPATGAGVLARFAAQPDPAIRQALLLIRSLAPSVASVRHCWLAYVIGGASAAGDDAAARMAQSCRLAIQASLWREGVLIKGEDPGGQRARSVYFDPAAGRLIVRSARALVRATQSMGQPIQLPCPLAS
jgi:chemotaxis receptor (MCP) glutamine deamidase CheD